MKRTVAFGALWTASAASAVGLGFLAVSLVDASASPVTQPIAVTESVTAAPSPSSSSSASGSGSGPGDAATATPTSPPPAAAPASREHATVGGTVFASCDGGVLQVAAAPAAGWWLDDQDRHGEVEFESATQKTEVHVTCADGAPSFRDEGVRADQNEPEDSGSASSSPASASSGADDSAGRSDDDGDDDGGRGRGRGGDDSGSDD